MTEVFENVIMMSLVLISYGVFIQLKSISHNLRVLNIKRNMERK